MDQNLGEVDAGGAQVGATASEGIEPASEVDPETDPDEEAAEEIAEEIQDGAAVGATPTGIATNNALGSLSHAARSVLLYEPRNQAIRYFTAELPKERERQIGVSRDDGVGHPTVRDDPRPNCLWF